MILVLVIVGLAAGALILSALTKDKPGMTGGYTGGESGGQKTKPGGGAVGGTVKNWANAFSKTIMGTRNQFFRKMANLCKGYDWDKYLPMAMAGLETNFSMSCYYSNLFNITTSSTDPSLFFMYKTIPGLKFKMYPGYAESVAHFWNLLKLSRYSEAYKNRNNPEQAIRELIKGGYAGSLKDPARYLSTLRFVQTYYRTHFG